jgi:hypothetical protein
MALTFLLDGQQFDSPEGWEGTSFARTFDHNTQITTLDYSQEYTFTGAGYAYLYGKAVNGQECDLVDVLIFDGERVLVQGVIFITDCVFNETQCSVKAKVEDDGFSARIENNLSIPVTIGGDKSKNGVTITPITPQFIFLFNQETGTYLSESTAVYTVHDAMQWFVQWMTDGGVLFRSDFFNVGGVGEVDTITSGINVLNSESQDVGGPVITFRDLFTTWRILRNVGMGFEWVNGQPQVRVEHIDFFRTGTTVVPLTDAETVELSFVRELLYSNIEIGSETTENRDCDSGSCGAFVDTRYIGFRNEAFGLTGTCNRDIPLTLTFPRDVIIDGNTIQSILIDKADNYNESTVCIERNLSTATATQSDPLNIGQFWYNGGYTNENILLRYVDYINGNIGGFQLIEDINLFLAGGRLVDAVMTPSIDYQFITLDNAPLWTDLPASGGGILWSGTSGFIQAIGSIVPRIDTGFNAFNSNNRYNPINGRYSIEFDGAFRFQMQFGLRVESGTPTGQVTVRASVLRYDIGDNLIDTFSQVIWNDTTFQTTTNRATAIYDSGFISGNAGEYYTFLLEAQTTNPFTTDIIVFTGWIELVQSRSVVETIQTNTAAKRLGVRRSFKYPLTCEDTDTIRQDITARVLLTSKEVVKTGVIERVEVNMVTGESTFDIITNV